MDLNLALDLTRYRTLGKSSDLSCSFLACSTDRYQNLFYKVLVRIRNFIYTPIIESLNLITDIMYFMYYMFLPIYTNLCNCLRPADNEWQLK